jgi:hypothetical protein
MSVEIKDRNDLIKDFENGAIPTGDDFKNLINAVLVKRSDAFFGKWDPQGSYQKEDVVLHKVGNKVGIYVFKGSGADNADCPDGEDCGRVPPSNSRCWQLIHLDVDDGDWQIYEHDKNLMYAKVYGKIGIGTKEPKAFLHLNDNDTEGGVSSQFLFNPLEKTGKTSLHMAHTLDEGAPTLLDQNLDVQAATWWTNTPLGYIFQKRCFYEPEIAENTEGVVEEISEGNSQVSAVIPKDVLLMLVGSEGLKPRIGIGTDSPKASLDVSDAENEILLSVDGAMPSLTLLKIANNKTLESVQSLDNQLVKWLTNAPKGFLFQHKNDRLSVAFSAEGNVGIGTKEPKSKLEIVDEKGNLVFHTASGRASLDIINNVKLAPNKTQAAPIKLSLSSYGNTSNFTSNASNGFSFQTSGDNGNREILSIQPDPYSDKFNLVVEGVVLAAGSYVPALVEANTTPLESGLALLENMNPRISKVEGDDHQQIGFSTDSLTPAVLRYDFSEEKEGIALHNLVAVLVKAVKELEAEIEALKGKINPQKQSS